MYYAPNILTPQIIQSGAFRLYNGNTYITTFGNAKMIEVSYDGQVLFEYSYPEINSKINRAQKYPGNYLHNTIGDLNNDNQINLLDIIILVEIIISEEEFTQSADIDSNQIIDILDIILLINQILD